MLVSLNWLKQGLDKITVSDEELVKLIGARLVEVEGVIDNTHKYDKVYAVQVKYCEKIPDTHLSLCRIDDGGKAADVERDDDGYVQVMCGAPNVHEGMFAAWVAPGAIVPSTFGTDEPFKIGMRKMLGKYDSYGMMAGADEVDLGDDHTGIIELDSSVAEPGKPFAEIFDLSDKILDIENKSLTHRPDTFGILGFRREVAGILGQKFQSPEWYLNGKQDFENDKSVKLDIEIDEKLCPRYTALVLESTGAEYPKTISTGATLLARSGMHPIDPVVDATNLCMLTYGQPLHAFDYDKFVAVGGTDSPKIIVRAAKKGEKLELLDGTTVELTPDDIVITSNDVPVALAGAMGGKSTAIDENTKRIILESATFSLYNLRKTQMAHGIFSEAITRFTKGQPAGQTLPVALRCARDLQAYFKPLAAFDTQKEIPEPIVVNVTLAQINGLLGADFSDKDVKTILENVEFAVELDGDNISVTAPFWRTDIHIAEDIIEEVGRLTGFDNIKPVLPLHATADPNPLFALKSQIREHLSARGANEVLTYSFVHASLMEKVGQDPNNAYKIVNSISPELQHIRQSIVPSLLDKSYGNLRAGYNRFALYEMNQVYPKNLGFDDEKVPQGEPQLGFVFVDGAEQGNYYLAKKYLESLLGALGVKYELGKFTNSSTNSYYEPKRSASIIAGNMTIGYLGEIKGMVTRSFKLPRGVAAFELDLTALLALARGAAAKTFRLSNYPSVSRDLTLTVAGDTVYAELEGKIRDALKDYIYQIRPVSIYQADGADTKNISFHLEFAHPDKTLTKAEIQDIMNTLESIK